MISGGADVDPGRYGEEPHPHTSGWRPDRDAWELALLDAAEAVGLPVLGVCRGMQVMAVHAGGMLEQHLPDQVDHEQHSPGGDRFGAIEVVTTPGSRLATLVGDRLSVGCHHHQSVRTHPGFEPVAHATDGTLEAMEVSGPEGRFCIGVQWHPETAADVGLLAGLVRAAAARAAGAMTLLSAHRCVTRGHIERRTRAGVEFVEFDVQRCRDGALVLHHDPAIVLPGGDEARFVDLAEGDARALLPGLVTYEEALAALAGRRGRTSTSRPAPPARRRPSPRSVGPSRCSAPTGSSSPRAGDSTVRAIRDWGDERGARPAGRTVAGPQHPRLLPARAAPDPAVRAAAAAPDPRSSGASVVVAHHSLARLGVRPVRAPAPAPAAGVDRGHAAVPRVLAASGAGVAGDHQPAARRGSPLRADRISP